MNYNSENDLSTKFHDILNNSIGIKAGINLLRNNLKENDNFNSDELIEKIDKEFERGLNNWKAIKSILNIGH